MSNPGPDVISGTPARSGATAGQDCVSSVKTEVPPAGALDGVRVDTHIYAGYTVPPYYDSLLAKIICRAKSREECIVKMKRALEEFIIEGVKTTIPFHMVLMDNEEFRSGKFDTGLLDRFDYVSAIKELEQ